MIEKIKNFKIVMIAYITCGVIILSSEIIETVNYFKHSFILFTYLSTMIMIIVAVIIYAYMGIRFLRIIRILTDNENKVKIE